MFVQRKRSILSRFGRLTYHTSNISFMCNKRYLGFTVGKLYKPFAYSLNSEFYKDFAIFDDFGRVLFMERKLIDEEVFNIIHTSKSNLEFVIEDAMYDIDAENEKYKRIANENI